MTPDHVGYPAGVILTTAGGLTNASVLFSTIIIAKQLFVMQ